MGKVLNIVLNNYILYFVGTIYKKASLDISSLVQFLNEESLTTNIQVIVGKLQKIF